MRILVVKNKKHKSSYIACIHRLLENIGRMQGYQIGFADNLKDAATATDKSIIFVSLTPASSISKFIQQQMLKAFIKKNKTDLLIQNVVTFIKQKTIPQLFITDDTERLPQVKKISYSKIFLLTYSLHAKQTIADKGFANLVHVVSFYADAAYQPITWSMKQQIKIDYTQGREYFYIPDHFKSIEDILKILRAFSGFKKWQQSSMKLVIAGKLYMPQDDWEEKLNTYKYREDILVCSMMPEEEKARLLAGAYACIHVPGKDSDLLPLLQSVQCHTPVITFNTASITEYAPDAVLTAAADDYEKLTQQMILMYKDENLRNKLIENCTLLSTKFSKETAMEALQTIIL